MIFNGKSTFTKETDCFQIRRFVIPSAILSEVFTLIGVFLLNTVHNHAKFHADRCRCRREITSVSARCISTNAEGAVKIFNDTKRARSLCDSWASCLCQAVRETSRDLDSFVCCTSQYWSLSRSMIDRRSVEPGCYSVEFDVEFRNHTRPSNETSLTTMTTDHSLTIHIKNSLLHNQCC